MWLWWLKVKRSCTSVHRCVTGVCVQAWWSVNLICVFDIKSLPPLQLGQKEINTQPLKNRRINGLKQVNKKEFDHRTHSSIDRITTESINTLSSEFSCLWKTLKDAPLRPIIILSPVTCEPVYLWTCLPVNLFTCDGSNRCFCSWFRVNKY